MFRVVVEAGVKPFTVVRTDKGAYPSLNWSRSSNLSTKPASANRNPAPAKGRDGGETAMAVPKLDVQVTARSGRVPLIGSPLDDFALGPGKPEI